MLDARDTGDKAARYLARRNCSISPRALIGFFCALALVSILIALTFSLFGAWPVLPFAGLELIALACAFVCYARHATDYECIEVQRGGISVEVCDGDCRQCYRFNCEQARLEVCEQPLRTRLFLRAHGKVLEIGRFLGLEDRRRLAEELRRWLKPAP